MTGGDCIFFQDDERNSTNVIAFHKYSKIEFTKFKDALVKRSSQFSRMRSKVVKVFGRYMFKDMGVDALMKDHN